MGLGDALSVTPRAGGEATHLAGYRITVYRKQSDGRWLLARDAHTLSPVEELGS
jgi:ketosteroid isomerase-like protein